MLEKFRTFEESVATYDPAQHEADRQLADEERARVLAAFPLSGWPELALSRFAQGTGGSERSFCAWMEQGTSTIAAMPAWKADVHIIYKGSDGAWHYPDSYTGEKAAWNALRAGYIQAFTLAQAGDAAAIDALSVFKPGRLTLHKALAVYYPDRFLPICATEHLKILAQRVLRERWSGDTHGAMGHMALNALVLQELRAVPELVGRTTWQLMRFLYDWTGPKSKDGRLPLVYKIAPGEGGRLWDECLKGGYICIGWDQIGDLRKFKDDRDRFMAAFSKQYRDAEYKGHQPTTTRKGRELWSLTTMQPGTIIVANRGIDEVLAIGEVQEPGYVWLDDRGSYRHGLRVAWDTTRAHPITPQPYWAHVTIHPIDPYLFDNVLGASKGVTMTRPDLPLNLILYGPPGTGKTWTMKNEIEKEFVTQGDPTPGSGAPTPPGEPMPWWRAVALALQAKQPCTAAALVHHPLIRARKEASTVGSNLARFVGNILNQHTVKDSETVATARRVAPYLFDKDEQGRWFLKGEIPEARGGPTLSSTPAIVAATSSDHRVYAVTFHPSFTYEDFVVGIRPWLGDDEAEEGDPTANTLVYERHLGVFYRACERAIALAGWQGTLEDFCAPGRTAEHVRKERLKDAQGVLLAIDEINRGNVARILGELITLIEPDKRLGAKNEMIVELPGTGQRFGVPSNLWIVGTMNTADRSVVALDTALRRRFVFKEMRPDLEKLKGVQVEGVQIDALLRAINDRLVRLKDEDHQIGHSFFWDMVEDPKRRTIDELKRIFCDHLLPLLREYFYDDLGRVGLVLGPAFVDVVKPTPSQRVFAKGFDHELVEDLADRPVYRLKAIDKVTAADFQRVYA